MANTIHIEGHVLTFEFHQRIKNYFYKRMKEVNASLLHETGVWETLSLQYGNEVYSRFEVGSDEVFFGFSGFWDVAPECEKNCDIYNGIFKTPNHAGWWKLTFKSSHHIFLDLYRFQKVACGLYKIAKEAAEGGENEVFYMWDDSAVLYIEGENLLYITYGELYSCAYRVGDFSFVDYDDIAEINGVSFYVPPTKFFESDDEPENDDEG